MIQIDNLHKRFGKNQVLQQLGLHLEPGGIHAILGPNGSGKTTLIKCILGMVLPDKGEIKVNGANIRKNPAYREEISYLPQIANFPGNLRVRELIDMILDLRKKNADPTPLTDLFGLGPHLDKKLSTLSGGTLQKVNLVLTFMFDSPLYILDEPTTGLDPASLIRLKQHIRKLREAGKTLLVTTHIMQFVEEVADQVIYLLEGRIYFRGTLEALKEKTGQQNVEHAIAAIAMKQHV